MERGGGGGGRDIIRNSHNKKISEIKSLGTQYHQENIHSEIQQAYEIFVCVIIFLVAQKSKNRNTGHEIVKLLMTGQ